MIKAVLLDLDDTLLDNPTEPFAHHMIEALDAFLTEQAGWRDARNSITAALRAVIENRDPLLSNLDVFLARLEKSWSLPMAEKLACFAAFYQEVFPRLQEIVQPRAAAPGLVHWLIEAGYRVVIATNPIFTAEAVTQRLAWAGLPDDLAAYAFVTHMANTHFTKPHPHYYEEILARIGAGAEEALMVGDDRQNDIVPAEQAGLNTFWIRPAGAQPATDGAHPDGQGTLDDFARQVCGEGWLETLTPHPPRPAMLIPRLSANVAALFGLRQEIGPEAWQQRPAPDEWSPSEVARHLRDAERLVLRPRLEQLVSDADLHLVEPSGPAVTSSAENEPDPADGFAAERATTLAFLESLPAAAWERPARHPVYGAATLLQEAAFVSSHDRAHIQQVAARLKKNL